jgi:hypothetical protein
MRLVRVIADGRTASTAGACVGAADSSAQLKAIAHRVRRSRSDLLFDELAAVRELIERRSRHTFVQRAALLIWHKSPAGRSWKPVLRARRD